MRTKWYLTAAALLLVACGDKLESAPPVDGTDTDVLAMELAAGALQIGENEVANWEVASGNIVIPASDPRTGDIQEGSVLVGGSEETHFLRRVTAVEELPDGRRAYRTENAALTDAFETLDIAFSMAEQLAQQDTRQGMSVYGINVRGTIHRASNWSEDFGVTFDETDGLPAGFEAGVNGTFDYGIAFDAMADLDLRLRIWQSRLEEARLTVTGTAGLHLTEYLRAQESYARDFRRTIVAPYRLMTLNIYGIWLDLMVSMDAGMELSFDAEAEVSASQQLSGSVSVGVEYKDGQWNLLGSRDFSATFTPPVLHTAMTGTATAYIAPRVSFEFFSVAGPYVEMKGFGELEGTVETVNAELSGALALSMGFEANAGGQVDVLGQRREVGGTLFEWREELWSRTWTPTPDDTDTVDTDTVDSDTVDSDTVDTDTIDSDTIDTDSLDTDTVDTDTIDTDSSPPEFLFLGSHYGQLIRLDLTTGAWTVFSDPAFGSLGGGDISNGQLLVADYVLPGVHQIDPFSGAVLANLVPLNSVDEVEVDVTGDIYVTYPGRVYRYDPWGVPLSNVAADGSDHEPRLASGDQMAGVYLFTAGCPSSPIAPMCETPDSPQSGTIMRIDDTGEPQYISYEPALGEVRGLAVTPDGTIYVATAPSSMDVDTTIYSVDPFMGYTNYLFTVSDKVADMEVNAAGQLIIATELARVEIWDLADPTSPIMTFTDCPAYPAGVRGTAYFHGGGIQPN